MDFIDEQNDIAVGGFYFGDDRLDAVFELSTQRGTGQEGAEIQGHQSLVLQRRRHIADGNAVRESLDDGVFADAGLADQHGVVFAAAAQHLDDATHLVVTPDDGVELAVFGLLHQIDGVFAEGAAIGDAGLDHAAALGAHLERLLDAVFGRAMVAQQAAWSPAVGRGVSQRRQQMAGVDELSAQLGGADLGGRRDFQKSRRKVVRGTRHPRQLGQLDLELLLHVADLDAHPVQHGFPHLVDEQGREQMLRLDGLVLARSSDLLGFDERGLGFGRVFC